MMHSKLVLTVILAALAICCGCKSEKSRLEDLYAQAGGAGGNRAALANELRKQWAAGKITIVEAVSTAHTKLDSPGDGASVVFAGAVLDVVGMIQPDIDKDTNELFWVQVGTLAGKSAGVAFQSNDIPLARSLVLAGSDRWQNEAYWRQHAPHDAAASIVMHRAGETKDALDRLRSRPELVEETQAAYDLIEKDWRKSRGG